MADGPLDVNNYSAEVEREMKNVKKLSIDDDLPDEELNDKLDDLTLDDLDGDAYDIYLYAMSVRDDIEPSSAFNRIARMRRLSEVATKPLTDMGADDVNTLLIKLAEKNLGDGKTYQRSTKRKYLETINDFADRRDLDELKGLETPSVPLKEVDADWALSKSEVWDLINAADKTRTKAVIAVSWECAWRVSALLSLKIKDYRPKGNEYGLLKAPVGAVGLKGAGGHEKPVTIAKGYLENWLAEHPSRDDDEAALFCRMDKRRHHGKHMTAEGVRRQLNRTAENAGIDKDRVNVHAFRHARATFMKKSDAYDDMHIEHTLNWTEGTNEHKRYEHLTQSDKINSILRVSGIEAEDDEIEPEWQQCPQCQRDIPFDANTCPYCSLIVDDRPAGWYQVYKEIRGEDDPIVDKYSGRESTVPQPASLPPTEWNTVREVIALAMHAVGMWEDGHYDDIEVPFDPIELNYATLRRVREQLGTRTDNYAERQQDYEMIDAEAADNLRDRAIEEGIIELDDD